MPVSLCETEDLILKMARARDASAFVAAFESRLGEIVLSGPHLATAVATAT